jgi:hypothetical protein
MYLYNLSLPRMAMASDSGPALVTPLRASVSSRKTCEDANTVTIAA